MYALGLLLYELLTGRRPYGLHGRTLADIEQIVCHPVPPGPSRIIDADRRSLRHQLAGDLDTIVLKALRKEPARRYDSAAALAADIERHLTGVAIHARNDELTYRLGVALRRHRARVLEAAIVALVVVVGLVVWWTRPGPARGGPPPLSIAILPFGSGGSPDERNSAQERC